MASKRRFAQSSDEGLKTLQVENENKNTKNQDEKWERVFKSFLAEHDMNDDFYAFDVETLNQWLSKLWLGARLDNTRRKASNNEQQEEGKCYQADSLHAMRYAIN